MIYAQKLIDYANENNYYWSVGTHPEWKYDARVWQRYIDRWGKGRMPTRIGFGNTLDEAIEMCLSKPKLEFEVG